MRYSLLREISSCHSQAHFTNLAENTENKIVDSLLSAKSICCVLAHLTSWGCIPKLISNNYIQIKAESQRKK